MSEIRTNVTISGETLEYRSNIEISIVTLNSKLEDTHSSFRTNIDISTELNDGTISNIKTTLELDNISLDFYLVDMTKLNQSLLYFSKFFNMYFEPEVMWELLAQGTNEQINISHLSDALSNYATFNHLLVINESLSNVSKILNEHINNNSRHLSEKEREFLEGLMNNPPYGSGDSLFELIGLKVEEDLYSWAVKPFEYKGNKVGIVSDSYISCRGLDITASSNGITRSDLFTILSGEPLDDSEYIDERFIKAKDILATQEWVYSQLAGSGVDVPPWVRDITLQQIQSWDLVASLFKLSDDDTYVYTTNDRGFVSNSFISCKGIDDSSVSSGSITRTELFDILSGEPLEGEYINPDFIIGLDDIINGQGFLKEISYSQVINALGYTPLKKEDFSDFNAVSNIVQQDVDNWNFVFGLIGLSEDKTYIFPKESRGFASLSFISCKGVDSSANQNPGVTYLNNLLDVSAESPNVDDVLAWDGTYWVNKKITTGLDIDAMWTALSAVDSSRVIDISHIPDLSSKYLSLSGGTINNTSGSTVPLTINTSDSLNRSMILFKGNNANQGEVGYAGTNYGVWLYNFNSGGYLGIKNDGTPHYNLNTLIHAGNIGSQYVAGLHHKDSSMGDYYIEPYTYGFTLRGQFPTLRFRNDNYYNSGIEFVDNQDIKRWTFSYRGQNNADRDFYIYSNAEDNTDTVVMALDYSSGNVSIGYAGDGGAKLYVAGTGRFTDTLTIGTTPITEKTQNSTKYLEIDGNLVVTGAISFGGLGESTGSGGGINIDGLWQELTTPNTSRIIDVTHIPDLSGKYLPLINAKLSSSVYNGALEIQRTSGAHASTIKFSNNTDGVLGSIGIGGSLLSFGIQPYWNDGSSDYVFIHSGNIGKQSVTSSKILNDFYNTRISSANISILGDGTVRKFVASSSMTEGKPPRDGSIVHFAWDNNGGYEHQLFVCNNSYCLVDQRMAWRGQYDGAWGDWRILAFTDSNVASATKLQDNTAFTAWGQTFFQNGVPNNVTRPAIMRYLLFSDSDGGESGYIGRGGSTDTLYFVSYKDAPIHIGRNSYNDLNIIGGNVGLGTLSPAYRFDVVGTLNATTIYQNGQTLDKYYLPLSGGTISNNAIYKLTLNTTDTDNYNLVGFSQNGTINGYIGTKRDAFHIYFPNYNAYYNNNALIHSGNVAPVIKQGSDVYSTRISVGGVDSADYTVTYSSLAAIAWKLSDDTAYTVWGQTFFQNGVPKSVNGALYDANGKEFLYASGSLVRIGSGTAGAGQSTFLDGNSIYLRYGTSYGIGLFLNSSGNVGIGTSSPAYKLDVAGTANFTDNTYHRGATMFVYHTGSNYSEGLRLANRNGAADTWSEINFGCDPAATSGTHTYQWTVGRNGNSNYFVIRNNNSNRLTIDLDGKVSVGILSAGATTVASLTSNGNIVATGAITFGSDERYKTKLSDVSVTLEDIANAPLFKYRWTDRDDKKVHLGTTAQYWNKTNFRNAVCPNDEKLWTMSYSEIAMGNTIVLARELIPIKREVSKIEKLENRVSKLERILREHNINFD